MSKIGNEPNKYVRRADLSSPRPGADGAKVTSASRKREREFLSAPIDSGFYIDFKRKPSVGKN